MCACALEPKHNFAQAKHSNSQIFQSANLVCTNKFGFYFVFGMDPSQREQDIASRTRSASLVDPQWYAN